MRGGRLCAAVGLAVLWGTAASALHDLRVVDDVALQSGSITVPAGQTVYVVNTVTNTKKDTVADAFEVGIYVFDTDRAPVIGTDDPLATWTATAGLAENATEQNITALTIPDGLSGTQYIVAYADYTEVVAENAEGNNWASLEITVGDAPDLTCAVTVTPDSVEPGDDLTVDVSVTNSSTVDVTDPFDVEIWLSSDGTALDTLLDTWNVVDPVDAGATVTPSAPLQVNIAGDTVEGEYYIVIYIDSGEAIAEGDETNNQISFGIGVGVPAPVDGAATTSTPFDGGCSSAGPARLPGRALALVLPLALALVLLRARVGRRRARGKGFGQRARDGRDLVPSPFAVLFILSIPVWLFAAGCAGGGFAAAPARSPEFSISRADLAPGVDVSMRLPAGLPERSVIGARVGMLMSSGEDKDDYSGSFMLGGYYPGKLRDLFGLDIPFEAGIDLAWIESDDGEVESSLLLMRFDCLFSRWEKLQSEAELYWLGGFQVVRASSEFKNGTSDSETASALDLGVGLSWADKHMDARLTYSIMMGSGNVGGLLLLTFGYSF